MNYYYNIYLPMQTEMFLKICQIKHYLYIYGVAT